MTEITHKNCSKCSLYLPREKFYPDNSRPDGLRCACKKCERRMNRKAKLNLRYGKFLTGSDVPLCHGGHEPHN